MVVPLAAMAGRAILGAGVKQMGAAATRSLGGKMLSTGTLGSKDLLKVALEANKYLKKISSSTLGMLNYMAKYSPALQQQMVIMSKAWGLIVRPFGDLFAKAMRPLSAAFLKFSLRWNDALGYLFGTGGGALDKEDKLKSLNEQLIGAEEQGRTDDADKIKDEIAGLEKNWAQLIWDEIIVPSWQGALEWVSRIWDEYIVPAWQGSLEWVTRIWDEYIVPAWAAVITWAQRIWDEYISPAWIAVKDWVTKIWDEYISPAWIAVKDWVTKIWDEYISPAWSALTGWATKIWDDYIAPTWAAVTGWGQKIWDDYIVKAWDGIKNWGDKVWTIIKDAAGRLNPFKSSAVGGEINKTGPYLLHAGERVLTAGDNSRSESSSNNITITNHFTINASINNDMDINSLARKLASYNETELRRRVSYG